MAAMKSRKHRKKTETSADLEQALGRVAEEKIREFREKREIKEEIVLESMKNSLEKLKRSISEGDFFMGVDEAVASFKQDMENLKLEREKIDKTKDSLL